MIAPKQNLWRMCGGCFCYVVNVGGKKEVYLAPTDKKKLTENVLKLVKEISEDRTELWINSEDDFSIRVSTNYPYDFAGIEIKHPELPEPDRWYKLSNWMLEANHDMKVYTLMSFIQQIDTKKGVFEGTFTPVFCDELPRSVSFTHPDLQNYDSILDEAERRMNVDYGKKTTKWKPGNRYDTLEMSYFYVRDVYSRILNRGKSGSNRESYAFSAKDYSALITNPVQLFLVKKPDVSSNIWDNVVVSFSDIDPELNYVDYLGKKVSAVDCGNWLPDTITEPITDPKEWRIKVMTNTLEKCCKNVENTFGHERVYYRNLNLALEPLYLYLGDKDESDMGIIGEYINPILTPVLRNIITEIITNRCSELINSSGSVECSSSNVDKILNIFLSGYILENFYSKTNLITQLFTAMGIDIKELIKEEMKLFRLDGMISTWENYLKNNSIIPGRDKCIDLRPGALFYHPSDEPENISDTIKSDVLRGMILDTIKWSLENHRSGIDNFSLCNGRRKSDKKYYEICVTLPNILNRMKIEGRDITDQEKKAIMDSNFWSMYLNCPEDINWDNEY